MKAYLKAFDLWEVTETGRQLGTLRKDPTLAQLKAHDKCAKGFKALSCIYSAVSDIIFTRIMACETAMQAWDRLKEEFHGSENSKQMLLGEDLSDKRVIEKVLVSLPDRFESKISSLEDSKDLSKITLPELKSSLQAIEQRRIIREEDASEEAFISKQKGKQMMEVKKSSKERDNKGKQPESGSEAVKKGRFPPCPTCKKTNHLENDCWQKNCSRRQDDHLFMASQSLKQVDKLTWIIDSGCISHMARNEDLFTSLDKLVRTKVKLGNGEMVQAEGKGTISMQIRKGTKYISDVLFIPSLDQNLLTVAQMLKKGYSLVFKNLWCHIRDSENCEVAKSFPSDSMWRAKEKLELVHSDVCGPMSVPSLRQNKYFILFIDDLTRMTWAYFISSKAQVFSVFKKFKALVEKQSGCKIKTLRSDNGKEYTFVEFEKFCEEAGIVYHLTVPYSPQQNGVSKRKNRTIVEMARCMLKEKELPKEFWAEAIYTTTYLLNRLPTRSVDRMTPIEAWFESKPSAKHLKVFGSICYMHVPAVKKSEFDDKAELGIFLGYAAQSKGYRLYNIMKKHVSIHKESSFTNEEGRPVESDNSQEKDYEDDERV
ncbi:uncharacterized protein LOC131175847 [Hevea brasiliensis]|uniref:uncharacterized protein LOC131175847 n=1 Tax=Hevea brasiliensis TaxID=3981 RepID=UPI0025D0F961|nr:uncharacterized protein LOC131175847 [Hevea brasiliensis]